MKVAIIDWIAPGHENITPYISRKSKCGRGFNHERTGALLCPTGLDWSDPRYAFILFTVVDLNLLLSSIKEKLRTGEMHVRGDHWPYFLYADLVYNPDDPWKGLLRSQLLVTVSPHHLYLSTSF